MTPAAGLSSAGTAYWEKTQKVIGLWAAHLQPTATLLQHFNAEVQSLLFPLFLYTHHLNVCVILKLWKCWGTSPPLWINTLHFLASLNNLLIHSQNTQTKFYSKPSFTIDDCHMLFFGIMIWPYRDKYTKLGSFGGILVHFFPVSENINLRKGWHSEVIKK